VQTNTLLEVIAPESLVPLKLPHYLLQVLSPQHKNPHVTQYEEDHDVTVFSKEQFESLS